MTVSTQALRHPSVEHGGKSACHLCVIPRLLGADWNPGPQLVPGRSPIPNELKSAGFVVVGEAPGEDEEKALAPFVGASGRLLAEGLLTHGYDRSKYSLANACRCRPPGNDMVAAARKAKAMGLLSPVDACRGSLLHELKEHGYTRAIALGGTAAKLLMRSASGIFALRGGPAEIPWSDLLAGGRTSVGDSGDDEGLDTAGPAYMPVAGSAAPGVESGALQVLPTFHPAFVARAHRWMPIFLSDLGRALRLFSGTLRWTEPTLHYQPTADQLYTWLSTATVDGQRPPFWSFDFETTIADPMVNDMLCLAIGLRDEAVCVGFKSCEEAQRLAPLYPAAEEARVREVVKWFFASRDYVKVAHNAYFDKQVAFHHFGVWPSPVRDTILMSRLENSELPHGLGVVGSIFTDVSSWKADNDGKKLAVHASTDFQMHKYCMTDAVVTWRILPPMAEKIQYRQLQVAAALNVRSDRDPQSGPFVDRCPAVRSMSLLDVDHRVQEMCVGMHRNGMWVDQSERLRLEEKYEKEAAALRRTLLDVASKAGWGSYVAGALDARDAGSFDETEDAEEAEEFMQAQEEGAINPSSYDNVRDLLYDKWGLIPIAFTKTGLASTSNQCIREHLADRSLGVDQRAFLDALRRYRRIRDKYLGTYIRKMAIGDADGYNVRIVSVPGKRKMLERRVKAMAWPSDGRIRPTWNAHVTNVGRLACSGPNQQNAPGKLRSMFGPPPGRVWVVADVDQFHLAIVASRWRIARLLHCFREKDDPHLLLGADLFGDRLLKAQGYNGLKAKPDSGSTAEKIRDTSKTLRYAGAYGASPETIWHTMTRAEDKNGDLIYLDLTLREVQTMYRKWMQAEPEWKAAWEYEVAIWLKYGFSADSVLGRRCDFTDCEKGEPDRSAIANYPVLATESAIMHLACMDIMDEIPFGMFGPGTGLVGQIHDEVLVEVPEEHGEWAKAIVRRAMNRQIGDWPVPFTAETKIVNRWKKPV